MIYNNQNSQDITKEKKMRTKNEEITNDLDTIDFEAIDSQEKNLK